MNSDKLKLIKDILREQLESVDFDKEIARNQKMLNDIRTTPADEFSFSGNIEHGITNLLDAATTATHPIGYLTAKKIAIQEFLGLLEKDKNELKQILEPNIKESNSSFKHDFLEKLKSKEKTTRKHFFECELTNEDWGSENCICPGSYIYKKYLSIGLSKEEAKLISDYREIGDLLENTSDLENAKKLYIKHKFLNLSKT